MNAKAIYLLYSLALLLFLLPLSHTIGDYWHIHAAWNDGVWLLVPFIAVLAYNKASRQLQLLTFCLIASGLLFICNEVSLSGIGPSWAEWLRLSLIIVSLSTMVFILSIAPLKKIIFLTVAIATLHSQWAIGQFIFQHDLHLNSIGESHLSPSTIGVAKFAAQTGKLIRPYGPYAHANSLAGILLLALCLCCAYLLFSKNTREQKILYLIMAVIFLGLILTYSRAAYIGAALLAIGMIFLQQKNIFSGIRHWVIPVFLFPLALSPLLLARATDPQDIAISERATGLQWAWQMIHDISIWRGIGSGQYTAFLQKFLDAHSISYQSWQIVPLHNTFLLAAFELGIIPAIVVTGTALFYFFFSKNQKIFFLGLILPIMPALLSDHYFLTQSAPLFLLLLAATIFNAPEMVSLRESEKTSPAQSSRRS
jgi:hypothetical protein